MNDRVAGIDEQVEQQLAELAENPGVTHDSTLRDLHRELETLAESLRQPTPLEAHEAESACLRAVEQVAALAAVPPTRGSGTSVSAGADLQAGTTIGQYRLLAKLGQGGMGAVYQAVHLRLEKVVALKVLPPERLSQAAAVARFQREMKAVGKIDHPNLVRASDAGEADGVHYLVMEFVDGKDLSQLLKSHGPLPIAQACELIRQACLGLQAAHQRGLIHRDVKPANLMLARQDFAVPTVKVLDLGLALLAGAANDASSGLSHPGHIMGTFDYMAPEQAGDSHAVDARVDIFSLGASLFALLTGQPPYHGPRYQTHLQKVRALAIEPIPSIRDLRPDVPEALAAIVDRMLAKEREARYANAGEVAQALAPFAAGADLASLLDGEPASLPAVQSQEAAKPSASLSATPVPAATLELRAATGDSREGRKELRKPRRRLAIAAGLIILISSGLLLPQIIIRITDEKGNQREIEIKPGEKLEIVRNATPSALAGVDAKPPAANVPGLPPKTDIKPELLPPLPKGGEPLSPAALVQRPAKIDGVRSWTIETVKPRGGVLAPAYSPDGKLVAFIAGDDTIRLIDATTYKVVRILVAPGQSLLAWHPEGKVLVSAGPGVLRFWDSERGLPLRDVPLEIPPVAISWSPNGKRLAVGCLAVDAVGRRTSMVDLRDGSRGKLEERLPVPFDPHSVSWSPDGEKLAACGVDDRGPGRGQSIWIWDAASLKVLKKLPNGSSYALMVSWSPDSKRLFVVTTPEGPGANGATSAWNVESAQVIWKWAEGGNGSMAYSPDGTILAFQSGHLVSAESGKTVGMMPLGFVGVFSLGRMAWSPDSKLVAVVTGGNLAFCDVASGKVVETVEGSPNQVLHDLAWSPEGNSVGDSYGKVAFEVATVKRLPPDPLGEPFEPTRSPNGKLRLAMSPDFGNKVAIVEISTWKPVHVLERGDFWGAGSHPWSPDSKRVVLPNHDGVRIWDVQTGKPIKFLGGQSGAGVFRCAAFSSNGKLIAGGENDHATVVLWDAESGDKLDTFRGHTGKITGLLWSADSKTLTSSAADGMRDWNVATGRMVRHRSWRMGWPSPDGRFGAEVHVNTIRVWDLETGRGRLTILPLPDDRYIAFSPEGHYRGTRPERDIAYVVQLDDGRQETLTPEEFAKRFGWKNDPEKVGLAESARPRPAANLDADRRAAAWVLSIGGNIQIWRNSSDGEMAHVNQVPEEPFQLRLVYLNANQKVRDADLEKLEGCRELRYLFLHGTPVTDVGLAHLKQCHKLKELAVGGTRATVAGLANFKDCKDFRRLYLQQLNLSDSGLELFRDCVSLEHLHLQDAKVDDASLELLKAHQGLTWVEVEGTAISADGVRKLAASLRQCKIESGYGTFDMATDPERRAAEYALSVGGAVKARVGGQERDITTIANLPKEGEFALTSVLLDNGSKGTDAGMWVFDKCKNLTHLILSKNGVTDAWLTHFRDCENLTNLNLNNTGVTDAGLAQLKNCKKLEHLWLMGTQVTDSGLALLRDFNLKGLELRSTGVTDTGLANFQDRKDLTYLHLGGTRVTDAGLACFKSCRNLQQLVLSQSKVTDSGLAAFKDCKNLRDLELGITEIGDAGLLHFKECKNLIKVDLQATRVTDAGLAHLKGCENLTTLLLQGTRVTDKGLANFKNFKNLRYLNLSGTRVTAAGLAPIPFNSK